MTLACLVLLSAFSTPQEASDQEIWRFVERLGDPSVDVRDQVMKRLAEIGEPAMPSLRIALRHQDAEIRSRAAGLIESMEWRLAEKKFEERAGKGAGARKKWERLIEGIVLKWSPKYRIFAEEADEESMPAVAAVARDGTSVEARGIGVVNTFLPLVFGESKADADQERREVQQACMLVLQRAFPLHFGITVQPGFLGYIPERDERDQRGGLRTGFTLNYLAWGPQAYLTLRFGDDSRLVGLSGRDGKLEAIYGKIGDHLRIHRSSAAPTPSAGQPPK
jgi:hypothetical protein